MEMSLRWKADCWTIHSAGTCFSARQGKAFIGTLAFLFRLAGHFYDECSRIKAPWEKWEKRKDGENSSNSFAWIILTQCYKSWRLWNKTLPSYDLNTPKFAWLKTIHLIWINQILRQVYISNTRSIIKNTPNCTINI